MHTAITVELNPLAKNACLDIIFRMVSVLKMYAPIIACCAPILRLLSVLHALPGIIWTLIILVHSYLEISRLVYALMISLIVWNVLPSIYAVLVLLGSNLLRISKNAYQLYVLWRTVPSV